MSAKVDTSDPRVKRHVYNMYRNILGNYNEKANLIVNNMPKERVTQDQGISRQLESMIRQSSQISQSGGSPCGPPMSPSGGNGVSAPFPPPPPPMAPTGGIPSVRIPSEIGPKKCSEPPAAIQNAMMTKDKKPFTYTPGGLDLTEIRSPRMARRINRNAQVQDSCSGTPQPKPSPLVQQPPGPLPPAVVAAMQPQLPVQVFPSGPPPPHVPDQSGKITGAPPPPPMPDQIGKSFGGVPLPPPMPDQSAKLSAGAPPAPPMPDQSAKVTMPQVTRPDIVSELQRQPSLKPVGPPQARPDFVAEIPNHAPLRPVNFGARYSQPQSQAQIPQPQLKSVHGVPKPSQESTSTKPPEPERVPESQNESYGYQPSKQVVDVGPPQMRPVGSTTPPIATLNKSPAPWMSTTQKQPTKEVPPWATLARAPSREEPQSTIHKEERQQQPQQPLTPSTPVQSRIVTIQIEGREPPSPQVASPQYSQIAAPFKQDSPQQLTQGRTRIIPIQIEGANDSGARQQQPVHRQASLPSGARGQPTFSPTRFNQSPLPYPNSPVPADTSDGKACQQLQSQQSWSQPGNGAPIQSRSFRVLQKMTGSDEQPQGVVPPGQGFLMNRVYPRQEEIPAHQYLGGDISRPLQNMVSGQEITATVAPDGGGYMCGGWYPNNTPSYPPSPYPTPYWYYPPQTPEEQQQFWEHYSAMCAYMAQMNAAAYRYSPYPMMNPYGPPYSSDSEEGSGYSSTDEMTYYNNLYQQQIMNRHPGNENCNPTNPTDNIAKTDSTETIKENITSADNSGSDTEVDDGEDKKDSSGLQTIPSVPDISIYKNGSDNSEEEEDEEEEADSEEEVEEGVQENMEEIPHQLSIIYEESDVESCKKSNASEDEEDDSTASTLEEEISAESTVNVRLPLKLSFSRSDDNVTTTVVVGELEANREGQDKAEEENEDEDEEDEDEEEDEEEEDDDTDPDVSVTICLRKTAEPTFENSTKTVNECISGRRTESPVDFWKELNGGEDSIQNGEESETEGLDKDEEINDEALESDEEDEDSSSTCSSDVESERSFISCESAVKTQNGGNAARDDCPEMNEVAQESEDDSGVTSDTSRHVSEVEVSDPESELGKMSRCQRAATHSRLFKLLQEECADQDEEQEAEESLATRKERLSLPLHSNKWSSDPDSLSSSSGINSPSSPIINERLVRELVQSLLSRKKGRHFRKLPLEKLHAAALRILQEDMDAYDTGSTSDESHLFMPQASPVDIPHPEIYGVNYYDYCDYYNSWGEAQFRGMKPPAARCPRIPNSSQPSIPKMPNLPPPTPT